MTLVQYLTSQLQYRLHTYRIGVSLKGIVGFLKLWAYAWQHTFANVNITVQRMALPVIIKSILTQKKAIIVLHHYDKNEKRNALYHLNAYLLFKVLSLGLNNVKVVVVANYWKTFLLNKGVDAASIVLFPNLFDASKHSAEPLQKTSNRIYFGQYGTKQLAEVHHLIHQLAQQGYESFFTTPHHDEAVEDKNFSVLHLPFDAYKKVIQQSAYAVCLSAFNEGWNRVAHECLLLGTHVIGNDAGGLGELLKGANQPVVNHVDEVYALITSKQNWPINQTFLKQYDISQISYYAVPIIQFCKA